MARISSQGTIALLEVTPRAAAVSLTGLTKASPAVATVGAGAITPFVDGSWVTLSVPGWTTVNGRAFQIGNVNSGVGSFELLGSNTTNEAAALPVGATVTVLAFQEVCFNTITRDSPASATVDVTTLCDEARVTVAGMPSPGTITFAGFYDSEDLGYQELRAAYETGDDRWFVIDLRDGSKIALLISINSLGESLGVDQGVSFTSGANVSGRPLYYRASVFA